MKNFQNSTYERVAHTTIPRMNFYLTDSGCSSAHLHADLEILLMLEGSIEITTRNERFALSAGELALFNPYQTHAYAAVSERTVLLVLQIDPAFCRAYYPRLENIRFETSALSAVLSAHDAEAMAGTCFDIGYNYFGEALAYEFRCIGDINRLMALLLTYVPFRSLSDRELFSSSQTEQRMERILSDIHAHFREKITLEELAEHEQLTSAYLSRFFKAQTGQTFQAYLTALRLEQAVQLLTGTDLSILDVSIESGFSDLKYMTKAFSQQFGMTAGAYRKQHRQRSLSCEFDEVVSDGTAGMVGTIHFSKSESLAIMRKSHHFDCDDADVPNRIYAV